MKMFVKSYNWVLYRERDRREVWKNMYDTKARKKVVIFTLVDNVILKVDNIRKRRRRIVVI